MTQFFILNTEYFRKFEKVSDNKSKNLSMVSMYLCG